MMSYTGGQTHYYGDPSRSKRISFSGDPKVGDASVAISNVLTSDTATYQCKVKKAPGVDTRKVTLVVMGEEKYLSSGSTCSCSQSFSSSCSHLLGMFMSLLVSLPLSQSWDHTFFSGAITRLICPPPQTHLNERFCAMCLYCFLPLQFPPQCQSVGLMVARRKGGLSPSAVNRIEDQLLSVIRGRERAGVQCQSM